MNSSAKLSATREVAAATVLRNLMTTKKLVDTHVQRVGLR